MMRIERTIKYEADRVRGFGREIMSVPGCEQLQSCIQCGTLFGRLPLSIYMISRRARSWRWSRRFQKRSAAQPHHLALRLCYACTRVPRQIRITDIMYALKQRAILKASIQSVSRFGVGERILRDGPRQWPHHRDAAGDCGCLSLRPIGAPALGSWRLGLGMIRTGRFGILPEHIKRAPNWPRCLTPPGSGEGKPKEVA